MTPKNTMNTEKQGGDMSESKSVQDTLRKQIQDLYDPDGLLSAFRDRPEMIRLAELELRHRRSDVENIKLSIEEELAELMDWVVEERGEDGKPKYSNEAKRKAALLVAAKESETIQNTKKELSAMEGVLWHAEVNYNKLKHQFATEKVTLGAYTAELNSISG